MTLTQSISKPWGHEYLLYETPCTAIWCLHICSQQATSLHCHPNKKTGLVILNGTAKISFLRDSLKLNVLDKLMIRQGLFHSTCCVSNDDLIMLEIEHPKNKDDIIRLKDKYGRQSKLFMADSQIEMTGRMLEDVEHIGNTIVHKSRLHDSEIRNQNIYMITGGRMYDKTYIDGNVVAPGDVISGHTLSMLVDSGQFESQKLEFLVVSKA